MLLVKGIVRALAQTGVFAALLLMPAGTWQWPRAIQFLVGFAAVQLITTIALTRLAPASLEARVQPAATSGQPIADRIVTLSLALALLAWFLLIPFDVFRLRLLPAVPGGIATSGVALLAVGYGLMTTALVQNAFATPVVGDQSERGQVLVDTGLYGHVRHPMYLGLLLFLLGLALWLESFAGVLALPLVFVPLVARILVEEKVLLKSLAGYDQYVTEVRYRVVPFLW